MDGSAGAGLRLGPGQNLTVGAQLGLELAQRPSHTDQCVAEGVLWLTSLYVDQYLATGDKPGPGHDILTGRYACYETYACSDGKWLSVGAIEPHFYANLCKALGCQGERPALGGVLPGR